MGHRKKVGKKTDKTYQELIDMQAKALQYVNKELRVREKELEKLRRRTSRTVGILKRIKHKLIDPRLREYKNRKLLNEHLDKLYNEIIALEKDMGDTND